MGGGRGQTQNKTAREFRRFLVFTHLFMQWVLRTKNVFYLKVKVSQLLVKKTDCCCCDKMFKLNCTFANISEACWPDDGEDITEDVDAEDAFNFLGKLSFEESKEEG